MTQEEKQLLLTDLCGRLPYDTIISVNNGKYREDVKLHPHYIFDWDAERWDAKPYLRPMSSMTENEMDEFLDIVIPVEEGKGIVEEEKIDRYIHFCNSHYLDWRNLIPMGLALEATEGMY